MFYREWKREPGQEHPVDLLVRQRVQRRDLERKAARLSGAILRALRGQAELWHQYEKVQGELVRLREETYFDLGVEQGLSAATLESLQPREQATRELTKRLLQVARSTSGRSVDHAAATVLAAWMLLTEETKRR